jgi:hypothetical protein
MLVKGNFCIIRRRGITKKVLHGHVFNKNISKEIKNFIYSMFESTLLYDCFQSCEWRQYFTPKTPVRFYKTRGGNVPEDTVIQEWLNYII